jgi:hypothetical protein
MAAEPAKTLEWVDALPAGPERQRLLEQALRDGVLRTPYEKLFSGEPPLALRLFRQLDAEGQFARAASLGEKRGNERDFTDLSVWSQNFPHGEVRSEAVAGAMSAVVKRDAASADALLASARTTADRDAALRGLAQGLNDTAPAAAATRALSIADAGTRREAIGIVMKSWLNRDRASATEWLAKADQIPGSWKQTWLGAQ